MKAWERSLGEQAAKFYGHLIQGGKFENSSFIPTAAWCATCYSAASAGGDLVATSLETAVDSVRPVTVLATAGAERLE